MPNIVIKTLDEIKQTLSDSFINAFGVDLNVEPSTPVGVLIDNLAADYYQLYLALQESYSSNQLELAQGTQLDYLARLMNITRKVGKKSICKSVSVSLTFPTTNPPASIDVPAGFIVKDTSGIEFASKNALTFTSSGVLSVDFESIDYGVYPVAVGALNVVVSPIPSPATALTVNNPLAAIVGEVAQTDGDLRNFYKNSALTLSQGLIGSVVAILSKITNVMDVFVYPNYSGAVSPPPYNLPANNVWIFIDYSDASVNNEIGSAILSVIPPIATFNSATAGTPVEVSVSPDVRLNNVVIKWTQVDKKPVNITIVILNNSNFSSQDATNIQDRLAQFFNSEVKINTTLYYSKIVSTIINNDFTYTLEKIWISTGTPTSGDTNDIVPLFHERLILGTVAFEYGT